MNFDDSRFIAAQQTTYASALIELRAGHKRGHWMWFIFPQLRSLGRSETARMFGLEDLAEAESYLRHPVLGQRLIDATNTVLDSGDNSLRDIFGYPDDLKFISSMTLFSATNQAPKIFQQALQKFNAGQPDPLTLALLKH